jgi:hypothetical protein
MKKSEKKKNAFWDLKKTYFLYYSFLPRPLTLHFKDDLESLRRCSYDILNGEEFRKMCQSVRL